MGEWAYILAGGRSSRFGSDKARALIDGEPMIRRVARGVEPLGGPLHVVADQRGKYDDLGLTTITDDVPDCGPMGGLLTALRHRLARDGQGWLMLVSCDFVEIRRPWIEALRQADRRGRQAVAFRSTQWQPLLGLYHTELAMAVGERVRQGRLAMQSMLDECAERARALPLPADWPATAHVNTPEEWAAAVGRLRGQGAEPSG
jgi:molybdopterin-guanine dinucleotide biosynthesis protein A